MKFDDEFITELNNDSYNYGRMTSILDSKDDCIIDGIEINRNKISTIQRFYESTNEYNRTKISKMINNDIDNIDVVYELILTANGSK